MICLIVSLMVTVTLPAAAANYSEKEVEKIEKYILKLEKKLQLKNELIESKEKENELLKKKVDNLNIRLNEQRKECRKKQLITFGKGTLTGAGVVLILLAAK